MSARRIGILVVVLLGISTPSAHAGVVGHIRDLTWGEGTLRLEVSGLTGFRSGSHARAGDTNINVTVEKEFKLYEKLSVGLRVHPLFFYDENDSAGSTIWGTGGGVTTRWYFQGDEKGWFAEVMGSGLVQSKKFRGNSTNFNFLVEGGVGYKFDSRWHVSGRIRHLSNGGFGEDNAGVNGLGIGIGFSF